MKSEKAKSLKPNRQPIQWLSSSCCNKDTVNAQVSKVVSKLNEIILDIMRPIRLWIGRFHFLSNPQMKSSAQKVLVNVAASVTAVVVLKFVVMPMLERHLAASDVSQSNYQFA